MGLGDQVLGLEDDSCDVNLSKYQRLLGHFDWLASHTLCSRDITMRFVNSVVQAFLIK